MLDVVRASFFQRILKLTVDNYPIIAATMERLEEAGLLTLVRLPLDRMATMSGSPEGHQWGPDHHRAVAETLAESLSER